jgi:AsmA protein
MADGVLNVRDLSAGMFGGTVLMNGEVKSGSPIALKFAMNAKNVDARQLQSALTSKPSDTLNGTIANVTIDLASSGASVSALVNALAGKGEMAGRNIIIKGIDVAQLAETAKGSFKPLERAGSLFTTFQNGQTQFDTFDATFPIQNGVANFTQLVFDGPRAKIEGRGNVNLPRWTVDLTNTVTVKGTDIPPFDVTIKGPLDNPLQAGGNIIEDYLRAKAQKKIEKLLVNEIEKRFGGGKPAETAAPDTAVDGTVAPAPKASKEEKAIKALQGLFGQ